LLVLLRQVIVGDAFLQKLGLYLIVVIGHQYMVLMNGRFVIVGIGGDAVLHLEEVVGVPVHIGFRRGRKGDHECVKIFKNSPILFKDAPVAFVNDDQIKMRWRKQLAPVLGLGIINRVEDGGVGGEHDACIPVIL